MLKDIVLTSKIKHKINRIDFLIFVVLLYIRLAFLPVTKATTDRGQATGKLYHLRLRVVCTLFCNLQNRVRTHAVLVIGLYELLGNPTT
jgi:hypothetical protein